MSTATRRRPVRLALVTAAAVAAGALGIVPAAPANAVSTGEVAGGTLVWGLSTYLNTTATGSISPWAAGYVPPASYDADTKLSTFAVESAVIGTDGSAVIDLDGASLNYASTGNRWLKFDDLVVSIDDEGNGALSALVSYGPGATGPNRYDPAIAPFRGPTRVNIVNLAGNTASENSATEQAFTFPSLDGTWSPALITFLEGDSTADPAIPGLAYRSQLVNDDPAKAPKPLSIVTERAVPTIVADVTDANYGDGVTVAVGGDGFRAVTNVGDAGVYVGLAPSGGLPDVDTMEGLDGFAAADWVTPARMASGAFSSVLNVQTADLEPEEDYSVYTWQAHGHSNTTQDTETPVEIDWDALVPVASSVTTGGDSTQVYGSTSTVTATVPGKGTITLTGLGAEQSTTLEGPGTATFTVPATLAAGSYTASLVYSGGGPYTGSEATKDFTVTKAPTSATIAAPASSAYGKGIQVRVDVPGAAGSVTLSGAGSEQTGALSAGAATFTLPASLRAGSYTLTAVYAGDANRAGATATATLKVAKAGTKTVVKVKPKPTAKKAGKATIAGPAGAKVAVTVKLGKKTVKKANVKLNAKGTGVVTLPKAAKGGKFVVTAVYAGDANHKASNGKASYTVKKPKKSKKR